MKLLLLLLLVCILKTIISQTQQEEWIERQDIITLPSYSPTLSPTEEPDETKLGEYFVKSIYDENGCSDKPYLHQASKVGLCKHFFPSGSGKTLCTMDGKYVINAYSSNDCTGYPVRQSPGDTTDGCLEAGEQSVYYGCSNDHELYHSLGKGLLATFSSDMLACNGGIFGVTTFIHMPKDSCTLIDSPVPLELDIARPPKGAIAYDIAGCNGNLIDLIIYYLIINNFIIYNLLLRGILYFKLL